MISLNPTKCCGMWEINDLSCADTPEIALKGIEQKMREGFTDWFRSLPSGRLKPFVIFTGVTKRVTGDHASSRPDDYGQAFADFVEKNGFGPVTRSEERKNHTTHNIIRVWIWHPDYPALFKYYDKLTPTPEPPAVGYSLSSDPLDYSGDAGTGEAGNL